MVVHLKTVTKLHLKKDLYVGFVTGIYQPSRAGMQAPIGSEGHLLAVAEKTVNNQDVESE